MAEFIRGKLKDAPKGIYRVVEGQHSDLRKDINYVLVTSPAQHSRQLLWTYLTDNSDFFWTFDTLNHPDTVVERML